MLERSKNSQRNHISNLRKMIKDVRTHPAKRGLYELLLLYIEGYVPLSFLESLYGSKAVPVEKDEGDKSDVPSKQVQEALRQLQEEDGSTS